MDVAHAQAVVRILKAWAVWEGEGNSKCVAARHPSFPSFSRAGLHACRCILVGLITSTYSVCTAANVEIDIKGTTDWYRHYFINYSSLKVTTPRCPTKSPLLRRMACPANTRLLTCFVCACTPATQSRSNII